MDTDLALLERNLWQAIASGDLGPFERMLAPGFISVDDGEVATGAELVAALGGMRLNHFELDGLATARPAATVAVITYRVEEQLQIGRGTRDRRTAATSVWVRAGEDWKLLVHHEITLA